MLIIKVLLIIKVFMKAVNCLKIQLGIFCISYRQLTYQN